MASHASVAPRAIHVDIGESTIQAFKIAVTEGRAMFEFWKHPKFWLAAVLVLWLAYVIGSNLEQVVTLHIIPWLLQPILKVSTIVIVSAIFGALITLGIQFNWRRSSKVVAQSATAAGSSSSTVA
jgi:hypothetical protein